MENNEMKYINRRIFISAATAVGGSALIILNLLEVVEMPTCYSVAFIALGILSWWHNRHRKKELFTQELKHMRLSGLNLPDKPEHIISGKFRDP